MDKSTVCASMRSEIRIQMKSWAQPWGTVASTLADGDRKIPRALWPSPETGFWFSERSGLKVTRKRDIVKETDVLLWAPRTPRGGVTCTLPCLYYTLGTQNKNKKLIALRDAARKKIHKAGHRRILTP